MGAPALIIADDGPEGRAAAEAILMAGGRALGRIGWQGAAGQLDRQGALGLVMVEAQRIDDALIKAVLPRIAALARDTDAPIVIALADHQIDLVSAGLGGTDARMLYAPGIVERAAAAAAALGARARDQLNDAGRDAEAARLRHLNQEVARIAETLARLTRNTGERSARRDDRPAERHTGLAPLQTGNGQSVTAREVRDAIRARRLRDQYFGRGLFEDPAWDMLLDLFAADLERTQVSVSSLCIAAAVAPTTALRWIAKMSEAGLFERHADPFDKRRAFMALSDKARAGMHGYFATIKQAELPGA
ncbi:hypothetical protein GCM10009087_31130 [Sphingomonas oligophenolica]